MEKKRYLIEIGTGVDMHGCDSNKAAIKAVRDALSHCCLAGIQEIHNSSTDNMALHIKICCPNPEMLNYEQIKEPVSFYRDVEITAKKGGASERGLYVPKMGDGETLVVAVAIITVYLKMDSEKHRNCV